MHEPRVVEAVRDTEALGHPLGRMGEIWARYGRDTGGIWARYGEIKGDAEALGYPLVRVRVGVGVGVRVRVS